MIGQIDIFIQLLFISSQSSEPVNMTERVTYLACDLIALLSLSFPLKLQTDPTYRFMVKGMFRANHLANTRMQWFRLHQLRIFSLLSYFASDTRERYKRLMEKMIKTRLAEGTHAKHDLFSILSKASGEGEDIRVSDIWTEAISFFPAGTSKAARVSRESAAKVKVLNSPRARRIFNLGRYLRPLLLPVAQ